MKCENGKNHRLVMMCLMAGILLLGFISVGHIRSDTQANIIGNELRNSRNHENEGNLSNHPELGEPGKPENADSKGQENELQVKRTIKAEKKRIKLLDTKPLVEAYQDLPKDQLDQEVEAIEQEIDMERFVERANRGELSFADKQRFSDLLLTLDSLLHVKADRKIRELEALVQTRHFSKGK